MYSSSFWEYACSARVRACAQAWSIPVGYRVRKYKGGVRVIDTFFTLDVLQETK